MKRDDKVLSMAIAQSGKKRKSSAAARVVAQANTRAAEAGKVTPLDAERIEHGEDENGQPTLTAIFPRKGFEPDRVNMSYLLDFPGLKNLFAKCFLNWGRPNAQITRKSTSGLLRSGWFRYLQQNKLNKMLPAQIDEQVLSGFNQWLHLQTSRSKGKVGAVQSLNPNTIRRALGSLRLMLGATPELRFLAERMPRGPRGSHRKANPTEVLTQAQLAAVWAAVEKEVLAIQDRWVRGANLLKAGHKMLETGHKLVQNPRGDAAKTDANLALFLAMLDTAYPGAIPGLAVIKKHNLLLGETDAHAFSHKVVIGYFYLSSRDLVPLALYITLATAFNPETVLKLTWSNIARNVDRIGTPSVQFDVTEALLAESENAAGQEYTATLLKIKGEKPRAMRQILRLLDPTSADPSQASLNLVLDLLRDMTKRIRPFVFKEHADRVFVFTTARGPIKVTKGFGAVGSDIAADANWGVHLTNFVKENELAPFTLQTLRVTLLDFVQLVSGGDLEKARQVGNHESRVTTWTHYTSDLVRRLLKEATGEILLMRDRWIETDGVIDPRRTSKNSDKACATPGFHCLDPLNSPRPNQKLGRLCDGFGECPSCPLAMASPGNSLDVAWWEALQRAIYRSVSTMTAGMWQERWAPVASDLKTLIETVPEDVLAKSRSFQVELPNVG